MRELRKMEPEELARRSGTKKETILYLERGKGGEPRLSTMEQLMAGLGVSMTVFEEMSALAEEIREAETPDRWIGPVLLEGSRLRQVREFSRKMGKLEGETLGALIIRNRVQEQAAKDREVAAQIGIYLRGQRDLVKRVREDAGCHLWSCAEWLCRESMDVIPQDRDRAASFAQAALVVAELAPGDKRFRARLLGYCWGHIANIFRVKNEFEEADATYAKCSALWREGAAGDPHGLLDAGRLMGMEASLRREQGRFTEALQLLQEAMPVATNDIRPYLRLNCGLVLQQLGDSEGAIRVLEEAAEQGPRNLLLSARFRVVVALCALGRHQEAEALLPEVKRLCMETNSGIYEPRVRWLSGRVAAGRGRTAEALGIFKSVQQEFLEEGSVYDAAIVLLDLAKIYLAQGETARVKALAGEMAPLFAGRGLHSYAKEALRLFEAAAVREVANVDLVARLLTYLERAQRSQGLRFEGIAA